MLLLLMPFFLEAQEDLQIYHARKFLLINYGERLESESPGLSTVTLNLRDSTIIVETPSPEITSFLQGRSNFNYQFITEEHRGSRLFYSDEFVFSISPARRMIVMGRRDTNPQMHSLRFYETE